jgi:CHAD domain-containing protein
MGPRAAPTAAVPTLRAGGSPLTELPPRQKWIEEVDGLTPTAQAAATILRLRLEPIAPLLALAASRHEEDVRYVHQLRVAIRRAEAAMRAFRSCFRPRRWRRLRRRLREIRRAAGDAREADVHIAMLTERLAGADDRDRAVLEHALRQTRRRRAEAQRAVDEAARGHPQRKLTRLMRRLIDSAAASDEGRPVLRDLAVAQLALGLQQVEDAAAMDLSVFEHLHALRIRSKRLRYALEIFASCFDQCLRSESYPEFSALQDHLGEINDAYELALRFDRYAVEVAGAPAAERPAAPSSPPGHSEVELDDELRRWAAVCRDERERRRKAFLAWWAEFRSRGVLKRLREFLDLDSART